MAAHMKKTEWDNIPEWAIYALEYGTEEDGSLNEEERAMIEKICRHTFPERIHNERGLERLQRV